MTQIVQSPHSAICVLYFEQEKPISTEPLVHILVVDDFADWRKCISEKLQENRSLRVIGAATDGLEAVLKAEELQPDLILLDIGLPKQDGLAAARQIRS